MWRSNAVIVCDDCVKLPSPNPYGLTQGIPAGQLGYDLGAWIRHCLPSRKLGLTTDTSAAAFMSACRPLRAV